MKKLILITLIAVISFSTFAQGNSQKNKNEKQRGTTVHKKEKNDVDGRYDNRNKKNKIESVDQRQNNINKFSKNTPRKVGDAFRRDYPNATNVTWTKNRGTWTANFGGGGIIGNTSSVTYKANGERVSSNGIFR